MTTSVYILSIEGPVAEAMAAKIAPGRGAGVEFVRLTTLVPIDTYGFGEESVGSVVAVSEIGISLASGNQADAPTVLVPWPNVASLSFAKTTRPENRPEPSGDAPRRRFRTENVSGPEGGGSG